MIEEQASGSWIFRDMGGFAGAADGRGRESL